MVALKTGGNPFFVMEILRSLGEEDQKKVLEEAGSMEFYEKLALPESVKDTIHRRTDELELEIQEILPYCAILGKEFHFDILRHFSGKNEGNLLDLLDRTVETYLLEEVPDSDGDQYRFHHALTADAIHSRIRRRRRRLLHRQAGEVMEEYYREQLDEFAGELARHFYNGEEYPKASLYAKMAGDQAKQIYANQEAIDFYTQALSASEQMNGNHKGDQFDLLINRSEILGLVGRTEEQKKDIEDAVDLALKMKDQKLLSDGYIYQSHFCLQISDYPKAKEVAERALKIKKEKGEKNGISRALMALGKVSTEIGETQKALKYYQEALKISKELGDRNDEGEALHALGRVWHYRGDLKKARHFYLQDLEICREIGEKKREGDNLNNLGVLHDQLGDYQKALLYYEDDLKLVRELGYRYAEAADLQNIGLAFRALGDYERALHSSEEALKIYREIGDKGREGRILGNIGIIYSKFGEYSKALDYHHNFLKISQEIGNRRDEGRGLFNIVWVYEDLRDFEKAINFLKRSLAIAEEVEDKVLFMESQNDLSSIYRQKGGKQNLKRSLEFAQEAARLGKELAFPDVEIPGLSNQAMTSLLLGKKKDALDFSKKAVRPLEKRGQMKELEEEIYLKHHEILNLNEDKRGARKYLKKAYEEMMRKAKMITDEKRRKSFLKNVGLNQRITETWKEERKSKQGRR